MVCESCTSTAAAGTLRWKKQSSAAKQQEPWGRMCWGVPLTAGISRSDGEISSKWRCQSRGQRCAGGARSCCVSGWNTTQVAACSIYGKLCFFLLVLRGLKHFASAFEWSPYCLGYFPHAIRLCQSQGQACHQIWSFEAVSLEYQSMTVLLLPLLSAHCMTLFLIIALVWRAIAIK